MRTRSRLIVNCAVGLLIAAGTANPGHAQVLYGSLTGNVTDPSSAGVPGAKVEALNTGTGSSHESTTDDRGAYLFTNLQPGIFKVTVSMKSFKTTIQSNVTVSQGEVRRADFSLQIAQTTETVEVSSDAVVLQTDKADIHSEVTAQEITELPYQGGEGKNFQSLLFLLPGAGIVASPEANSEAGNPQRAITLFMNGVSSTGNNTRLDGAMISYPWLPVNVAYVPPPEAIQTVSVSTNAFDAEQGAAGGAAVNVTIKNGTNDLHGVAFERNNNNDTAAVNNYFSHPGQLSKNIFNQYGFAIGGPIWIPKVVHGRNKLFFFVDYMGTKRRQYAAATNLTLPTAAMRTGDFSATTTAIYDPLTGNADGTGRTPFAGNIIPSNRIASASTTLTGLLPALTRPTAFLNNTDTYGGTQYNRGNWDYKVNYNPNDKTMIWGRYSISPLDIVAPLVLGPAGGDAFNGGNPIHAGGRVQVAAAGFTYTFSPTLLMDGNFGYTRQHIGANGDPQDGFYGTDVLKIPGTNGVGEDYKGIPGFQVTGVANIGNTNTGSPFLFRDNQYTSAINLSKNRGAHSLRFGFEYDKFALNHFQPQGGTFGTARGTFGFDGTLTSLKGGAAVNTGGPFNSWAQFLLGYPSHVGKITQFNDPNSLRFSTWSIYARDSWQATRNLTINYGLRWEYYPIYSHDHFGAVRFDPSTDNILIGGEGGVPWDTGATASKKNFAPRFGVAYRLGAKTVIRSGFGITVDPDNMRNQRNQYPSVINQDYAPANSYQFISYAGVPNSNGATQVKLSDGIPTATFPNISAGTIKPSTTASPTTYLPSTGTVTFPANYNRGYYESWNIFIQREFTKNLSAEAGYVGTHGVHVMEGVNINGSAPNTGTAGRQLFPYVTSDMNMYEPFGSMTYNGLQTRLMQRIGASFIGVSYTFAKAINSSNGDNGDGTLWRAYPVSYSLDKQLAGFDRTHTFQLYYVYQLPFGKGHEFLNHGPASWIAGGWELTSTISRYSGLPFTVGTSSSINAGGQGTSATQVNPTVAILGGHDANTPYFDGTAFVNPPTGVLGSTGRNILRGPGLFNLNQNITRTFAFKDGKIKLQLVGEAFNLTNTVTFSNPQATCCWVNNATTGAVNYNNFAVITGTASTPRFIQVGGYLRF
ncbi:MAG TPA: TonB-dependent receptor [Candidatus Acidoferrales bacterium]|nr:TonB-dependent receptor [Candidatus Acidoferrales bacterium]